MFANMSSDSLYNNWKTIDDLMGKEKLSSNLLQKEDSSLNK